MSTDVSTLASKYYQEMKKSMHAAPVELMGTKSSYPSIAEAQIDAHTAAVDAIEDFRQRFDISDVPTQVELVDVLTAHLPKATQAEPETKEPDLVAPGFVPVNPMPARQAEMQKLIMLDPARGAFYAGRLASSGRHLWSHHSSHALVVDEDQFIYFSRLLRDEHKIEVLPLWDGV